GPDYRGRTGFLGGSFNPIHLGHLSIAQQVREKLGLVKVILVPNNRSPFKQGDVNMAPPAHRLAMCKLAIKNMRGLEVSDREIKRFLRTDVFAYLKEKKLYGWKT
ncbi:MAG TPA: nicotinate-nicotinamide nucleotide adenylyltransferase, partial [Planctomycetota bacterium]|nr:nicotinate-nicotinamide nucleotide adenylyltransferase [Planctomycetota bacterium]